MFASTLTPTPHSHRGYTRRTPQSSSKTEQQVCSPGKPPWPWESKLVGTGHVGATISLNYWHFKLQERQSGVQQPRLVKQQGSQLPAKGQPTERLCRRQQLQAFWVNAFLHRVCIRLHILKFSSSKAEMKKRPLIILIFKKNQSMFHLWTFSKCLNFLHGIVCTLIRECVRFLQLSWISFLSSW